MTFQETLDFLYRKLPMYQRVGKVAYKKDLTNTIRLLRILDNPHEKFKSVHIAGTNGKGTSAHGIAAILQVAGYRTGLYTSPHLKSFTERIRIDGKPIDNQFVINFVERIRANIDQIRPSFFEITVAMAFEYFSLQKVDIAVVETGLGGRLDSTNVISPEVCLITNIGMDHTEMLGDTLEKIAFEKAGIIKPDIPVVLGKYQEEVFHVFREKAESLRATLQVPQEKSSPTANLPYYKKENEHGIVLTSRQLMKRGYKITEDHIRLGIEQMESLTNFKGRFQTIQESPKMIADVSHNVEGLKILFDEALSMLEGELILIFGTVKDKELKPLFDLIPKQSKIHWTQANVPRSLAVNDLQSSAEDYGLRGDSHADVNDAIDTSLSTAKDNDLILITGSTFVVAEINNL